MDEISRHRQTAPNLKDAIRRARLEDAERSEVVAELRGAELARLEMLETAIEPVLAQVPEDVDLFDVGIAPSDRPRLFIDMIAYVEMGRDRRQYRFVQNMRHGRVVIAESESLDVMAQAVAAYIARRLVEREKALAADDPFTARASAAAIGSPAAAKAPPESSALSPAPPSVALRRKSWAANAFQTLIEALGSLTLIVLIVALAWAVWTYASGWKPEVLWP